MSHAAPAVWPGDRVGPFTVGALRAYQGRPGCQDPECLRGLETGRCYGRHCTFCDQPVTSAGHDCPAAPNPAPAG